MFERRRAEISPWLTFGKRPCRKLLVDVEIFEKFARLTKLGIFGIFVGFSAIYNSRTSQRTERLEKLASNGLHPLGSNIRVKIHHLADTIKPSEDFHL